MRGGDVRPDAKQGWGQKRRFIMPTAMEQRLDKLVHELNEIKKEMILQKRGGGLLRRN